MFRRLHNFDWPIFEGMGGGGGGGGGERANTFGAYNGMLIGSHIWGEGVYSGGVLTRFYGT